MELEGSYTFSAPRDVVWRALMDPDVLDIRSTFVPQEIRGQGIGQRMVEAAISFAKEQHLQVRASCWYARELIDSGRVQC